MRPKGTIYNRKKSSRHGVTFISLPFIERTAYHLLRMVGAGFIGFTIIGFFFAYGPIFREEISYQTGVYNQKVTELSIAEAERIASVQKEAEYWGVESYFSVVVPKISAKADIIANVDPGNEKEYRDALKKGVAHAKGTYFPGQNKNIYLFSHSTDSPLNVDQYNAVFYLLRKLEKGDLIIVFFADQKYEYEVTEKIVTKASDTSYLNADVDSERLVLQTCDPPGTTWKRLLVLAKPKGA